MNKKEIVLASSSPRRKDILESLGIDFKVVKPDVKEEKVLKALPPIDAVKKLALLKAQEVANTYVDCIVIAADTVVVCDNDLLGKPSSYEEAFLMLKKLGGRWHTVITGVSLVIKCEDISLVDTETTQVFIRHLTDEDIKAYLKTKEYIDKAGAYAIQGKGALLVKEIKGDYYNVVGLPVFRLSCLLSKVGLTFSKLMQGGREFEHNK